MCVCVRVCVSVCACVCVCVCAERLSASNHMLYREASSHSKEHLQEVANTLQSTSCSVATRCCIHNTALVNNTRQLHKYTSRKVKVDQKQGKGKSGAPRVG